MKKSTGASWVGTVIGVAALAAIGIGGYNTLRTGCPLGSCESPAQVNAAAPAAKTDGCCPLTQTAATPAPAPEHASACCKGKSDQDCCKADGAECSEASCGSADSGCAESGSTKETPTPAPASNPA